MSFAAGITGLYAIVAFCLIATLAGSNTRSRNGR